LRWQAPLAFVSPEPTNQPFISHEPVSLLLLIFSNCDHSALQMLTLFRARGFFYPEDGGDTLLRNVCSYKIHTAPHATTPKWNVLAKSLRLQILLNTALACNRSRRRGREHSVNCLLNSAAQCLHFVKKKCEKFIILSVRLQHWRTLLVIFHA
jgi:hypothetical protein